LRDPNLGATREIFWNAPEVFKEHFASVFHFLYLGLPFVLFSLWGRRSSTRSTAGSGSFASASRQPLRPL
jgi:hypothetical protein